MKTTALACLFLLVSCGFVSGLPSLNKIYSAWFCGDDSCLWARYKHFFFSFLFFSYLFVMPSPPMSNQTWLVNRGDGSPTVNIIVYIIINSGSCACHVFDHFYIFAFVDPLKLLQGVIPAGFTQGEVNYYKNKNISFLQTFLFGTCN
jgi:hypothetical protein